MAQARQRKLKLAPTEVDSLAPAGALESADEKAENWADKPESAAYKEAARLYPLIAKQYDDQDERAQQLTEFWSIYNAQPDQNQQYYGNSKGYVPVVRDAVNARAKRALKQLFPVKHRHVEAVGADTETPYAQLALLEHYIRKTKLKDIVRSDLVAGDVTGQWNLYIDWTRSYRRVTEIVKRNPIMESVPGQEVDLSDPFDDSEEKITRDVLDEGPDIVDFAAEDLAVVPPTVTDIEKATATSLILRMSAAKVRQMVDEGVFVIPEGSDIEAWVASHESEGERPPNPPKQRTNQAGIRVEGETQYALIYEAAAMLDFEDQPKGMPASKRLGLIYYAGEEDIIGIIPAPWWGGKRPILSAPIERIQGSFFGISKIEPVKFMQWQLTDFWNMGQDSAMYSMLPIVMTDPLQNPNYASMVIGLAAVWSVDPNRTKFAEFPQLWKESAAICDTMKRQIWESMDVNEMMMGRMPPGRKNNAMIGTMQQEQMTNISDHAERYEEAILNPLAARMFEYDQQFRTDAVTVMAMGEVGVKVTMQEIPPQQWGARYFFQWAGTSEVVGMQRMQQQIATMNVLRGIPPQQLNGRRLDISPIVEKLVENVFGPELTPKILVDTRNMFTVAAEIEDELMLNGFDIDVHEADNHQEHLMQHQQAARATGDPAGRMRSHMAKHMVAMHLQEQAQLGQAQQGQGGMPGMPGPTAGGAALPGVAGTPRLGAQPGQPRAGQAPPGMAGPDQVVDPMMGPRG